MDADKGKRSLRAKQFASGLNQTDYLQILTQRWLYYKVLPTYSMLVGSCTSLIIHCFILILMDLAISYK